MQGLDVALAELRIKALKHLVDALRLEQRGVSAWWHAPSISVDTRLGCGPFAPGRSVDPPLCLIGLEVVLDIVEPTRE